MNVPGTEGQPRPQIFISYSRKDEAHARVLATALARERWSAWWDAGILIGTSYRQSIQSALDAAQCVIVLWSAASIESRWVMEEAQAGLDRNILLPVLIENVSPPLGFRSLQAARLWEWDGNPDYPEFRTLIEHIGLLLQPGTAGAADVTSGGACKTTDLPGRPANVARNALTDATPRSERAAHSRRWRAGLIVVILLALSAAVGVSAASKWGAPEKYIWQSEARDTALKGGNQGLLITVVNLSGRQIDEPLSWRYRRRRSAPEHCRRLEFIDPSIMPGNVRFRPVDSDPDAGILILQPFLPGAEERFGVKTRGATASECLALEPADLPGVHVGPRSFALARLRANPSVLALATALATFALLASSVLITSMSLGYLSREKRS